MPANAFGVRATRRVVPFFIEPSNDPVVGMHFRPGGAWPFFVLPAGELRNQVLGLETLWGARAVELKERLVAETTVDGALRVMEAALLRAAKAPLVQHASVPVRSASWRGCRAATARRSRRGG